MGCKVIQTSIGNSRVSRSDLCLFC